VALRLLAEWKPEAIAQGTILETACLQAGARQRANFPIGQPMQKLNQPQGNLDVLLNATKRQSKSTPGAARRLWHQLPAIIRAIIVGYIVVQIGGLPPAIFLLGNLKLFPLVPWLLPATLVWLWLFWRYCDGHGWPRSTAEARRRDLRARPLSGPEWFWSLLAGSLGMICVDAIAFLTPRLAEIPREAFRLPLDLSVYPWWTLAAILISISAVAGVIEEAGYRGYMLSGIERRHGWTVATLITGFVFFLDHHISHAYATFAYLPFFLAVSTLHGLLVYSTRSIVPSVVLHTFADLIVIPVQYGLIGHPSVASVWKEGTDSSFWILVGLAIVFGLAAIPAFMKLATVSANAGSRPAR
jgi:membrane protease YdiL (CAAX protease family)